MAKKGQSKSSFGSYLKFGPTARLMNSLVSRAREPGQEEERMLSINSSLSRDFFLIGEDDDEVGEIKESSFMPVYSSKEIKAAKHPLPLTVLQHRFLRDRLSARNILRQKLEQQGAVATFDFDNNNVHIDTQNPAIVDAALNTIKDFVMEIKIKFTEDELQQMAMSTDIPDGEPFPILTSDQEIIVAVDRVEGVMTLIGMKDAIKEVRENMKRSQKIPKQKSIKEDPNRKKPQEPQTSRRVPLRESQQEYIHALKWDEISELKTTENGLSIDMVDEGIEVTGPTRAVKMAVREIENLVEKIQCNKFTFDAAVNMGSFTDAIGKVGKKHNVVIAYRQCNMTVMNKKVTRPQSAPHGNQGERHGAPRGRPKTKVSIVLKRLETQEADVVVNTTNTKLALVDGQGVSNSLFTAAGHTIQQELNDAYPDGITHGDVAVSGPGALATCKVIYHAALPFYRGAGGIMELSKCFEYLVSVVFRTLIKASSEGYQTIALPAFGTGALKYPVKHVVQLIFKAIDLFNQDERTGSITEIFIVIAPATEINVQRMPLSITTLNGVMLRSNENLQSFALADIKYLFPLFLAHQLTYWLKTRQISRPESGSFGSRFHFWWSHTPSSTAVDYYHREVRSSNELKCEVRAMIGSILLQVIHGDIAKACEVTDAVLVPWLQGETNTPNDQSALRCMDPDRHQWLCGPQVTNLPQSRCTADSTSFLGKTLLHTHLDRPDETCIKFATQRGLKKATEHACRMLTLPIPAEGTLAARPADTASAIVKAIEEVNSTSSVYVVTVVIPSGNNFFDFVTRLDALRRLEVPADISTTSVADSLWSGKFSKRAGQSQSRAAAFNTGVDALMVVTSDSEKRNRDAADEVASELNVNLCDVQRT